MIPRFLLATLMAVILATTSPLSALADPAKELGDKALAALEELYQSEPDTKALGEKSVAILVFPEIVKGGVIIGGQFGEGALIVNGKPTEFYNIASASIGLQLGGQTFGYAMFFLTDNGLQYLRDSSGWELGVGPTLVGGDEGWSKSLGTNNLQGDIAPVFFGQSGLMGGGSIQGSKITEIDP